MSYRAFEKVNPGHPDKIADRIAGALVDYCYSRTLNPRCAFEVLIGHGKAFIIAETSVKISEAIVKDIVFRIVGFDDAPDIDLTYIEVNQDEHLADNQNEKLKCGDNGIFKGSPLTKEEKYLTYFAKQMWAKYRHDGKYVLDRDHDNPMTHMCLTVCQSDATNNDLLEDVEDFEQMIEFNVIDCINPLGEWHGSINTDSGATNRKIGSDMGGAATGGGLHGKDLSKADVTLNILCNIYANLRDEDIYCTCSIGDVDVYFENAKGDIIANMEYSEAVEKARRYIESIGGFEKFAEWGLIR